MQDFYLKSGLGWINYCLPAMWMALENLILSLEIILGGVIDQRFESETSVGAWIIGLPTKNGVLV